MGFVKEFKEFAVKGNVIDMAVGIIVGAAFTAFVNSLVNDLLMPPMGLLLGDMDFSDWFILLREGAPPGPYLSLAAAREAGAVTFNYGMFLNNVISFLILALAVFLLVRAINRLRRPDATPEPVSPALKKCPYCVSDIAVQASRCPHCTSELKPGETAAAL